jgi:acyl-CoA reductase-like NAD-dependent aldehyde dehydrogenase
VSASPTGDAPGPAADPDARRGVRLGKRYALHIGGQFVPSESGRVRALGSDSPTGGSTVPMATAKDIRDAARAAHQAWPAFRDMAPPARGRLLLRLAEQVEARAAEWAPWLRGGAPASRREIAETVEQIVFYAGLCDKLEVLLGSAGPFFGGYGLTVLEPLGVVAIALPDEPALLGFARGALPAFVSGNCSLVLASETHPVPALVVAECLAVAGFPPGVVNVFSGARSEWLPAAVAHGPIDAVHATGVDASFEARLRALAAGEKTLRFETEQAHGDSGESSPRRALSRVERFTRGKRLFYPGAI